MHCFYILASQRSGHHAFIEWILANYPGTAVHINNPPIKTHTWFPEKYIKRKPDLRARATCNQTDRAPIAHPLTKNAAIDCLGGGSPALLILNFEAVNRIAKVKAIEHSVMADFPTSTAKFILFSRDPLNVLASLLVRTKFFRVRQDSISERSNCPRSWQDDPSCARLCRRVARFTREFVYRKQQFGHYIDYASWLTDADYRRDVANQLSLPDAPIHTKATSHGGGSSFSGSADVDPFQQLHRFKSFEQSRLFLSIVESFAPLYRQYYQQLPTHLAFDASLQALLETSPTSL
jgi:hypothetical protein